MSNTKLAIEKKNSLIKHLNQIFVPIFLYGFIWLFVILLMSLKYSDLIESSVNSALLFYFYSLFCFSAGYFIVFFFKRKIVFGYKQFSIDKNSRIRFSFFLKFWIILTAIEVLYSKGIPIMWLIMRNGKTYFEFGIPSIHGLLNALGLSLGLTSFFYYLKTKKTNYLVITVCFILWYVCIITRQVIIVLLIELFIVYYNYSANKLKFLRNLIVYGVCLIFFFGVLGDLRTGKDNFLAVALPTDKWPIWLPSGFLWVYIYLATPINNLIYNISNSIVTNYNFFFPNTFSLLLPSVIRNLLYSGQDTVSGDLISQAFNVSSAYMSSYMDAGIYGIGIFAFFIGMFSNIVWWINGQKRLFYRAIIAQCILLSIFYNHFFYLPVIFQLFWIYLIIKEPKNESIQNFKKSTITKN